MTEVNGDTELSHIGPIERRHTTLHCNVCDYHHPFPDGPPDAPAYQHYCEHPDVLGVGQTDKKFNTRGRWIGSSDETPAWCPVTKAKDNGTNTLGSSRKENSVIPTRTENPNGLYQRYAIRKANGEECDPRAIYFVLRLDSNGDDPGHIVACRAAARIYVANAPSHLRQVAEDLSRLLDHLDSEPSVLVPEGDP